MQKKLPKMQKIQTPKLSNIDKEFSETVEALEDEKMKLPDCDIPTNENGESEEFELEAGIEYEGILHKTYVIREMNGKDEEILGQENNKHNSSKLINTLLARCIVRIGTLVKKDFKPKDWEDLIKKMYSGDQDMVLLKIRELSLGREIESTHNCPHCKAKITTYVCTDEFEILPFGGEREIHFELPRGYTDRKGNVFSTGVMRFPNGLDREILTPKAKKNVGVANTLMLTRLCKFDNGVPLSEEVVRNLTIRDREYLYKLMNDNAFGPKISVNIECPECGEEFEGNLNAVNFI